MTNKHVNANSRVGSVKIVKNAHEIWKSVFFIQLTRGETLHYVSYRTERFEVLIICHLGELFA